MPITNMKLLHKLVIPKISAHWEIILAYLQYDISFKQELDKKHSRDPRSCCTNLLEDWVSSDRGIGPRTYTTLLEVLYSIPEVADFAQDIKNGLLANGVTIGMYLLHSFVIDIIYIYTYTYVCMYVRTYVYKCSYTVYHIRT